MCSLVNRTKKRTVGQ